MWEALFFQFMSTTPRKVQVLGDDGFSEEDFDYEPGQMVPSHLPGENRDMPSPTSLLQRARWHMSNFIFHVTPNSSHQITQMAKKMLDFQLFRSAGLPFPMDPWTLAKSMDMNIGPEPPGTKNQLERWVAWMKMVKELMPQPQGKGGGRPPSGGAPPHMQQKANGRQTVSESR